METVEKLAKQVIELQAVERLRLVEAILFSLDKTDPDIEKSWVAEPELRYEAYTHGGLKVQDWNDIRRRYEN